MNAPSTEVVPNNRTLPRGSTQNCDHHASHYLKEELELEPGNGSAAVTVSSAASMNNVNEAAEVMRQRQRWTRRWYLLVIVLLYIGLLASFSLNVSLLLRKPQSPAVTRVTPEPAIVAGDNVLVGEQNENHGKPNFFKFSLSYLVQCMTYWTTFNAFVTLADKSTLVYHDKK